MQRAETLHIFIYGPIQVAKVNLWDFVLSLEL